MHANSREEISTIHCGEIAAAVGLRNTATGETLCDPDHPVILESMDFPEPVISVAIEPKTKADQDRMGQALSRLAEEDPTFVTETNEEMGDKVKIVKLNVDDNQETAGEYGVMSIPTLFLMKDGNVVDQVVGFQPKEALEELINKHA